MIKIRIDLAKNSYYIFLKNNIFNYVAKCHKKNYPGCRAIIITDNNVKKFYLTSFTNNLSKNNVKFNSYCVFPGEKSKSFHSLENLTDKIIKKGVNRNDVIYALGGGVIGDLAGFLSSILLRGIKFIQIPTTLLSQVDSSVGGKTAINTKIGKNLVGTFFQPSAVFIDPNTLITLPKKEFLAGYAEVVKYSIIDDKLFFNWLNKNSKDTFNLKSENIYKIITTCIKKKAKIVKLDEKEKKTRMLLNLGHTFAHALENELNYKVRHGEAVSVGILMAMKLSQKLGYAKKEDYYVLENHLKSSKLPIKLKQLSNNKNWQIKSIINKMQTDKKSYKGNIQFILCKGIGAAFIKKDIDTNLLKKTIEEFYI
ncbi:MAG: 3-dehydroquinate synthase [Pelagibacterales bacterium]|nr:3-dehydroquinate synthase [Pelagibacterales bacterium]OUU61575.1 MAG: 3-dehydroquinate synthase [Alphaproteobacteria bacterium TMED62]|tara:strand:+ start:9883 stop:10983 length:1101 start_codon:yes stop_codon:yes gene_type:complete